MDFLGQLVNNVRRLPNKKAIVTYVDSEYVKYLKMREIKAQKYARTIGFGKYKGKTIDEVVKTDRAYLMWFTQWKNAREPLKTNVKKLLGMANVSPPPSTTLPTSVFNAV